MDEHTVVTLTPFALLVQEQFTREWEAVVDSPDDQHARVAGQYSWKSNLWQFGLVSPVLCLYPIFLYAITSSLTLITPIGHRSCT